MKPDVAQSVLLARKQQKGGSYSTHFPPDSNTTWHCYALDSAPDDAGVCPVTDPFEQLGSSGGDVLVVVLCQSVCEALFALRPPRQAA
jgi:hypothetical protein